MSKLTDRALDVLTMALLKRLQSEGRLVINAYHRNGTYGHAKFPRAPAEINWNGRTLQLEDEPVPWKEQY